MTRLDAECWICEVQETIEAKGGGGSSSSSNSSQTQSSYDQRAGADNGSIAASGGASVSGTITNQSYNITASSDPVVVMAALASGMQAEQHALDAALANMGQNNQVVGQVVGQALGGELAAVNAALTFGGQALADTTAAVQSASPQADYQKLVVAGAIVLVIFFLSRSK